MVRHLFFLCMCISLHAVNKIEDMSLDEKIGQLFMVAAIANEELNKDFIQRTPYKVTPSYIDQLIKEYHVGGVIFLGKTTQYDLRNEILRLQTLSSVPLLIGLDAEWGIGMRVMDGRSFEKNGKLGQKTDAEVFTVAAEIAKDCKFLGVHINFAPVVDVHTNPNNPIIGVRSFGSDPNLVAKKSIAYMQGLHSQNILSCAKHFPGHGDTDVDSHKELPILRHNKDRLNAIELMPFKTMVQAKVPAIMIGHLSVPALDETGMPASLSSRIIGILRTNYNYDGLIITDGLGMSAITNSYEAGQLELKALLAGNDILLCPIDVPKAVGLIKEALLNGVLKEEKLNRHVERIIKVKKQVIR